MPISSIRIQEKNIFCISVIKASMMEPFSMNNCRMVRQLFRDDANKLQTARPLCAYASFLGGILINNRDGAEKCKSINSVSLHPILVLHSCIGISPPKTLRRSFFFGSSTGELTTFCTSVQIRSQSSTVQDGALAKKQFMSPVTQLR